MKETETFKAYLESPYRSLKHSTYFSSYDYCFSKFKGKPITFVEIGVLNGGSLFMWRKYFGKRARIIGVDLNPEAKRWEKEGFEIFIGSQSDVTFWDSFKDKVGKIDVVLDDGGHTYEQQIITTECLLDAINDGGVLVVEDTHTSYMPGFGSRKYSFIEYAKCLIDSINMRFSLLSPGSSEKRIWSIAFFESMVIFNVNKTAVAISSEPTDNGGIDLSIEDFRYADNTSLAIINKIARNMNFLKYIPFVKLMGNALKSVLAATKQSSKVKKYFKLAKKN